MPANWRIQRDQMEGNLVVSSSSGSGGFLVSPIIKDFKLLLFMGLTSFCHHVLPLKAKS